MLEHIIKNGERIENIVDIYKVSYEELKLANMHISDLKNVVPGMKIKVPLISEEIEQILDKTESFVMNYYPLVTKEIIEKKEEKIKSSDVVPKGRAYPGILPPKIKNKWENH